jgi:ribonuclease PH
MSFFYMCFGAILPKKTTFWVQSISRNEKREKKTKATFWVQWSSISRNEKKEREENERWSELSSCIGVKIWNIQL